jgi:hypothetical protein
LAFNAAVADFVRREPDVHVVVLAARWALSANGTRYGDERGPPVILSDAGLGENAAVFARGIDDTVKFLIDEHRDVRLVTQVPEVGWNVPSVLARHIARGLPDPDGPSPADYEARQRPVSVTLTGLRTRYPDLRVIDLAPAFCGRGTCEVQDAGVPLYRDEHHLSAAGAGVAAKALQKLFD